MKNADMPAMPLFNNNGSPVHHSSAGMENHGVMAGLTKREMIAMHVAAGFAADGQITTDNVVKWSVEVADKLLQELGSTSK